MVPIAIHENVSTASPNVVRRDPVPIGPTFRPVTRAPRIALLAPNPAPWRPTVASRRRCNVWSLFHASRWCGQIGGFRRGDVSPVARSPLVALGGIPPVADDPLAAGRQCTPDPTDPEEVISLIVPRPVARDPCHVVADGALAWRDLFNQGRRSYSHYDARDGVIADDSGEGLMHRSSGQHFGARLIGEGLLSQGAFDESSGQSEPDHRKEGEWGVNHLERCGSPLWGIQEVHRGWLDCLHLRRSTVSQPWGQTLLRIAHTDRHLPLSSPTHPQTHKSRVALVVFAPHPRAIHREEAAGIIGKASIKGQLVL